MLSNEKKRPVKFLVGTDWWTDCDDAVAMRVLAWAHKHKLIEILGIGINACMEISAASLDAFMSYEGLPNIAFGIDTEATDFGGNPPYQKRLSELAGKFRSNADCEDAVRLYRKTLHAVTEKIELVEIGYPQVLSNLLLSLPDDISNLSGLDLVGQKVKKLWMMAGKWGDPEHGQENNFARNQRSRTAAYHLCANWPTPITFLGWEVASDILTGDVLPHNDLLYRVLCDHGSPNGRSSWDPMLAYLACINNEKEAGYNVVRGKASVDRDTGINHFTKDENGLHQYVVKRFNDNYYKQKINDIILESYYPEHMN